MNQNLPALLKALEGALSEDVLPEVNSPHVRTQLVAVVDVLQKLERLVVWSPELQDAKLALIDSACEAVARSASEAGVAMPALERPPVEAREGESASDAALAAAEERLIGVIDWFFDSMESFPEDLRASLDRQLCQTLRAVLGEDRKFVARANFSAMSSGG